MRFQMVRLAKENILLIFTVAGVVAGVLLGITLRDPDVKWSKRHLSYLRFPGDVFVQMLKMLILPLIMSSIIVLVALPMRPPISSVTVRAWPLSIRTLRANFGMISLLYYFITTMMAVILGAFFLKNLMEATFRSHKVCMKFLNGSEQMNPDVVLKLSADERAAFTELPERVTSDGMNILGLVMFSVALGITIGWIGEEGHALKAFFKSLETVSMKLISLVIWYSPLGIAFLIASQIVGMKDPGKELQRLMGYMITVLIGLFIHGFVMLPILMIHAGKAEPNQVRLRNGTSAFNRTCYEFQSFLMIDKTYILPDAQNAAKSLISSSATLPLSIKCVEENNGVDSRVARFVLPLGATINMDGTALYEAVAAIYISQCVGLELTLGQIILVSLTATLASIGAAGIPQAGIVTMIMVLIAIGLPSNLFILIFPVDFFLDRIRTTVNVHGDSIGAAVVGKLCEKYLKQDRTAAGASSEHNEQGYSMLSTTASPDPSKRISIGNHHYENSHML
ncbi:transporter, dicarboxylate/amino acid:cation Na+/H+ symporter family protein [Cooperia oncophora]